MRGQPAVAERCARHPPGGSPDGFRYLIETEPWNGLRTPANSYMNGDPPGGPYLHDTDLAVPICR